MKSEVSVLGPKAVQCIFLWLKTKQNPPYSNLELKVSSPDKTSLALVAAVAFLSVAPSFINAIKPPVVLYCWVLGSQGYLEDVGLMDLLIRATR